MNIVFGGAGRMGDERDHFRRIVAQRYGRPIHQMDGGNRPRQAECIWSASAADSDGIVLGRAEDRHRRVGVTLLGCLNQPCPGWQEGSPMDSPDRTAQYLLDRYLAEGGAFIAGIFGQYAVVVADFDKQRLLLASDPTGLRTLFYRVEGGEFHFSSNLSALAAALPNTRMNSGMEDFFLCYGFYPGAQTPYEGLHYLKPGSIACFENGKLSLSSVAHPDPWADHIRELDLESKSETEAVEALHRAFMLSMEQQLASERKVAVLLGGADSALVASALHRLGKEVETFSFYYHDESFNQPHTDTLSRFLGTRHNWVPISPDLIAEGVETYAWKFNFPTNWLNYVVQTEHLCRVMKGAGFKFIYSGDGCDGTFLGYPRTHVFASFLGYARQLNPRLALWATRALSFDRLEYAMGRPYTLLLHTLRSLAREMPTRGYSTFRVLDETSLGRLKQAAVDAIVIENERILHAIAEPFSHLSMDRLAYHGKNALSPNRSKMAGSSDSTGVVINTPYLHSGMKSFALSIPDSLLRPQGVNDSYNGKYLLFKMCDETRLLPPEIIYQKKVSAVDAPVDRWYRGELRDRFRANLDGLPFEANSSYLDFLLRDSLADKLHRHFVSSDALTTHALSLLVTYASFSDAAREQFPAPSSSEAGSSEAA